MPNLIDILSDEDKAKVQEWKERRENSTHARDIPSYLYLVAELGYYYGWPAIEAVKRGHISTIEPDGSIKLLPLTMDEIVGLVQAAQKVKYRKMVEEGDITFSAMSCAWIKDGGGRAFDQSIKNFKERAK